MWHPYEVDTYSYRSMWAELHTLYYAMNIYSLIMNLKSIN
jgi:hypothetical protein